MSLNSKKEISSLDSDDGSEHDHLIEDGNVSQTWEKHRSRNITTRTTITPLRLSIIFLTSIFLTAVLTFLLTQHLLRSRTALDRQCAAHTSATWSPIHRDIDIHYKPTRFNGSFFHETIYRGDAGPEVDAAWSALGPDLTSLLLPAADAAKVGIEPWHAFVTADSSDDSSGNGGGGYPTNVEVLHQLHCLNLLRKSLPWNWDYYVALGKGPFMNPPPVLKQHVTHCLDALRQQLMCVSDTGFVPYVWVEGHGPFPDFSREHMCRNFDDVRRWAEERQAAVPKEHFVEGPPAGVRIFDDYPE